MKRKIAVILIFAFAVIAFSGCKAKNDTKTTPASTEEQKLQELKTKLDDEFTNTFGTDSFSGYVYITRKGSVLLDKSYGKANFEKSIENTKETRYDIGSITKQFTAFSIMQLQEKKLLNVNDTVDKYIPAFPHGSEITIHQLLSHTSGLPEYSMDFDIKKFRPSYKGFGIEGSKEKVSLQFKPGKSFQYSNPGYILLGYIIEKVSGKTLDVYFNENIFKPLDMKNTSFRDENGQVPNYAVGYQNNKKEKIETSWTLQNVGYVYGSGGLCSTVEDLLKWAKAMNDGKLITKESYNKMYTPNINNYGYGWYVNKDSKGSISCEHYGIGVGFKSYLFRVIDEDTEIIIISNYFEAPIEAMVRNANMILQRYSPTKN